MCFFFSFFLLVSLLCVCVCVCVYVCVGGGGGGGVQRAFSVVVGVWGGGDNAYQCKASVLQVISVFTGKMCCDLLHNLCWKEMGEG